MQPPSPGTGPEPISEPGSVETPYRQLHQHGRLGDLLVIHLINTLLRWATLNIYHFWAKTRIREYLWSHQSFEGDRFEYIGRGGELLVGFLKATLALIGLLALAALIFTGAAPSVDPLFMSLGAAVYLAGHFLAAAAGYSARGYLLSRTRWRSIRFGQTGLAAGFALRSVGLGFITLITLGLFWPIRRHILLGYKVNNTWFGTTPFAYDGNGRDLYAWFLLSYLLTIPTLGLIWFWYMARDAAYVASRTRNEGLRFEVGYTGAQLLGLRLGNLLITLLTFGMGYPWALLRNFRFLFGHLRLRGELDYERILQNQEEAARSGEGLAEIFGMSGGFLGLGRV